MPISTHKSRLVVRGKLSIKHRPSEDTHDYDLIYVKITSKLNRFYTQPDNRITLPGIELNTLDWKEIVVV